MYFLKNGPVIYILFYNLFYPFNNAFYILKARKLRTRKNDIFLDNNNNIKHIVIVILYYIPFITYLYF